MRGNTGTSLRVTEPREGHGGQDVALFSLYFSARWTCQLIGTLSGFGPPEGFRCQKQGLLQDLSVD